MIEMVNFKVIREGFTVGPVNLTLNDGQKMLVYGLNGAGKTTFLLGVLGAIKTSGSLIIDGVDATGLPIERRKLAYQPASPFVVPNLKVRDILALANSKISMELIDRLKMGTLLDVKGSKLSAGQARLTQIAAALLSDAKALLMDEPFAFLAEGLRRTAFELLMNDKRAIIVAAQERMDGFDVLLHL